MDDKNKRWEIHHQIAKKIRLHENTILVPKANGHGLYYKLFIGTNLWFWMDGYNASIFLKYKLDNVEETLCYVGIDFGGYESKLTEEQYLEVLSLLK